MPVMWASRITGLAGIFLFAGFVAGCAGQPAASPEPRARNVILFIGDGMGPSTVTAARIFAGQAEGLAGEEYALSFERFPHVALVKTYNTDAQVADKSVALVVTSPPYFTGKEYEQLKPVRGDVKLSPPNPSDMQAWVDLAEKQSYGVQVQEAVSAIAALDVKRNSAAHLPTLDAVATICDATLEGLEALIDQCLASPHRGQGGLRERGDVLPCSP